MESNLLSHSLSLFLLRELPFSSFDFPRWQAVLVVSFIAAGVLSANAYASETQAEAVLQPVEPIAAFTETDLNALFEQEAGKPMQLAALSGQEMKETEGAWLLNAAGAFVGVVSGAYGGYMTSAAYNRNASPGGVAWGLTRSIVVGAGSGAIRPVNSIGRAFGTLASSYGYGRIDGYAGSRGWW